MSARRKSAKAKPVVGHRSQGMTQWVEVRCECGWRTDMVRMSDMAAMWEQWRQHVAERVAVEHRSVI